MTDTELRTLGVVIAALGGAAIGVERERSGHATGPAARFAGVRTFTLLGGLAGLSGWLWAEGMPWLAAVLLTGAVALVVVAYLAVSSRDPDGTTEVAALVTLAAGVLGGLGHLAFSSAVVAVTALLLIEKSRVHALVERMDDTAVRAGIRFAVMAVVLMPLLPPGPYGPLGGVKPRELWMFVLFFSGISFAGYIARLFVGARHGYLVAGLLGGIVSSTSVTLSFSRASRREDESVGRPLAYGVLAACTTLFVRVVVATAVLSLPLARQLVPLIAAPFLVGLAVVAMGLRRPQHERTEVQTMQNPLQFKAALQMAALFQAVFFLVAAVRAAWGDVGLVVSGAILGLADVDALMISMAATVSAGGPAGAPATAVAVGILSNTLFKLALVTSLSRPPFRRTAGLGLAAMAAASLAALLLVRPGP
ncbi:MAG: MgtC/SapB family protein [Vicinamibacterales bacterium]